jgi:hypothetical protein
LIKQKYYENSIQELFDNIEALQGCFIVEHCGSCAGVCGILYDNGAGVQFNDIQQSHQGL